MDKTLKARGIVRWLLTGIASTAVLTSVAAGVAAPSAAAWSGFPPRTNSTWAYDPSGAGQWLPTLIAYGKQATPGHELDQIYSYGTDLECGEMEHCSDENFESYYGWHNGTPFAGTLSTAAYYNAFNPAPAGGSGSSQEPVTISPIIDGRTDAGGYLQGFDSISQATAQHFADMVAGQVCSDVRAAGVQFDIEPFNVASPIGGQYAFFMEIAKDFAGDGPSPLGCVDPQHPHGRYFSFFTFANAIESGTVEATNVDNILNTYHNGYIIDSLYDLGGNPAGYLNDPTTYAGLAENEARSMVKSADEQSIKYAFAIPAAASAHEYTSCSGACNAAPNGMTGAPMLGYTKAAVAAIKGTGSPQNPLFIGTDVWGFADHETAGSTTIFPASAQPETLNWLADNLPGAPAESGSNPPGGGGGGGGNDGGGNGNDGGHTNQPGGPNNQVKAAPAKPEVKLKRKGHGKKATYTFTIKDKTAGVKYVCRLDKSRFANCRSPKRYKAMKAGKHTFAVQAVAQDGQRSAVKKLVFKVKKTKKVDSKASMR
jgi:hypothetical protein